MDNRPMRTGLHKATALLVALCLLSSCSTATTEEKLSVPLDCDKTKVLAAFPEKIPNPKWIRTDWEPAEGTDLYAAYNAGGIACSYGIQEAEIGATILWAPDDGTTFDELVPNWLSAGQVETDLPGFDEDRAFVKSEGIEGQGEYHLWSINLLKKGFWIQVNATFFSSIDEAMPIIKAAADSILNTEDAAKANLVGCYVAKVSDDRYVMDITSHDNTIVVATVAFKNAAKDSSFGLFTGTYENGELHGTYQFDSEGAQSERELFFKKDGDGFLPGFGPVEVIKNTERLQRPLNLAWDKKSKYLPSDECGSLLQGSS